MRPEDCKGTNDLAESVAEWDDERAMAWHAVFEAMMKRNPRIHNYANTGMGCALAELRRLYEIEARYALVMLRNDDSMASAPKE